jgi:hypothetical protein
MGTNIKETFSLTEFLAILFLKLKAYQNPQRGGVYPPQKNTN